ncbi:MAG: DUF817 family protein [Pseudotabrizicola sp.]|uniref:DUF817 family protein n=1 Tax=Pseudotabrizicola sp. TaxID=2939647 RepID=UPI002731FCDA|nr:DUF817 family protein [Pseudotabrizicola sp.]MDP2080781.1 DUF817 family protein [Pseudotabrizicola sp.]MDZ7574633.1 DUF817 family protein [Pseudotabrizicola sp.]
MVETENTHSLERSLGDWARGRLPFALAEFVMFVLKQGWACLFGGLLLLAIIGTRLIWQADWPLHRYDALFVFAIATQAAFLALRLETWDEARVILLFHLTGMVMEWFKVRAGSWGYPKPGLFMLMGVPLFSGFMYAAAGSYMARVIRIFDMRFAPYPPFCITLLLGAAGASSLALWVAENVGTATGTWLYASQMPGQWVSLGKLGSWYLLLYVAFVTVTLVTRAALFPAALADGKSGSNPALHPLNHQNDPTKNQ